MVTEPSYRMEFAVHKKIESLYSEFLSCMKVENFFVPGTFDSVAALINK